MIYLCGGAMPTSVETLLALQMLYGNMSPARGNDHPSVFSSHRTLNLADFVIRKVFNVDMTQHKKAHIQDNTHGVLQIIGAGLPRTGTSSLKAALEILGFDPCHHMSVGWNCQGKS